MPDAFEKFINDNPEILERTRKQYWEKTAERKKQFEIAIQKCNEGYPRKAVVKWLKIECHWDLAEKTISDYLGGFIDVE